MVSTGYINYLSDAIKEQQKSMQIYAIHILKAAAGHLDIARVRFRGAKS